MLDTIDKGNGRSSENALGFYQYVNELEKKKQKWDTLKHGKFS